MNGNLKTGHRKFKNLMRLLMEKLEVTVEVLETKELSTINTIVVSCGMSGSDAEALAWHIAGCCCSSSCC